MLSLIGTVHFYDPKIAHAIGASSHRSRCAVSALVRTRISTNAPTASAYLSTVRNVGRVPVPLSRREIALFVVPILAATSACVMQTAVRAATRSATSTGKRASRGERGRATTLPPGLVQRIEVQCQSALQRRSARPVIHVGMSFWAWFAKMLTATAAHAHRAFG